MGTLNSRRSVPLPAGAISGKLLPKIVLCILQDGAAVINIGKGEKLNYSQAAA